MNHEGNNTIRKNETVSIKPIWIGWIVSHHVFVQSYTNGSHANSGATMTTAILIANIEQKIPQYQDSLTVLAGGFGAGHNGLVVKAIDLPDCGRSSRGRYFKSHRVI